MDFTGIVTSFLGTPKISILEAGMLLCWGISWPVSIIKTIRTKKVTGKSPIFMVLIAIGYVCAILHKVLYLYDYLIFLYLFNLLMILADLYLYTRYNNRHIEVSKRIQLDQAVTDKISEAPGLMCNQ